MVSVPLKAFPDDQPLPLTPLRQATRHRRFEGKLYGRGVWLSGRGGKEDTSFWCQLSGVLRDSGSRVGPSATTEPTKNVTQPGGIGLGFRV